MRLPIPFVDSASVPAATSDAISSLGITEALVVGTAAVISDAVSAKLPSAERSGAADLGAKVSGLGGTQPYVVPTNVVYVASSDRPVDVAVMVAAVARLDGTLLVVPGAPSPTATKTLSAGQQSAVDREVLVATPAASNTVPWPVLIVGGLLALVGIGLFVVARRKSA